VIIGCFIAGAALVLAAYGCFRRNKAGFLNNGSIRDISLKSPTSVVPVAATSRRLSVGTLKDSAWLASSKKQLPSSQGFAGASQSKPKPNQIVPILAVPVVDPSPCPALTGEPTPLPAFSVETVDGSFAIESAWAPSALRTSSDSMASEPPQLVSSPTNIHAGGEANLNAIMERIESLAEDGEQMRACQDVQDGQECGCTKEFEPVIGALPGGGVTTAFSPKKKAQRGTAVHASSLPPQLDERAGAVAEVRKTALTPIPPRSIIPHRISHGAPVQLAPIQEKRRSDASVASQEPAKPQ
jgi:hypothetical protein